ncbi:hypothetical protein L466_03873 [Enterobacter sp. BIDMC 30]|jgi:hypothetical protein|nr:hypothetical protein L466_03873 [Enterobacter sp. BIDMC 30]
MSNFYKLALKHRVGNNKVFFNRSYCFDNIKYCMANNSNVLIL